MGIFVKLWEYFIMVIGSGMFANKFAKYCSIDDIVLLASGVSNSLEQSQLEFDREFAVVKQGILDNPGKLIVYFSTSSMYDPISKNSPYTKHKLNMEGYIKTHARKYLIFRVSQVIGRSNNTTLINFIINHIQNEIEFPVWSGSTRNLIDLDDVYRIIDYIIEYKLFVNQTINVANLHNIAVVDIVKYVEKQLGVKAKYHLVDKGVPFEKIDISDIMPILDRLSIKFDGNNYLTEAIKRLIDIG
jgi:nucleoside-diphosphate-sugar epimerase